MENDALIKSLPQTTFSSPLKIIHEGNETVGRGDKLSLREMVCIFPERLSQGLTGQLFIDCPELGRELSAKVAVLGQKGSSSEGFSTTLQPLEENVQEESAWVQLYIRSLWQELTGKVPREYLDVISNNLVGVFEVDHISNIVNHILTSNERCYFIVHPVDQAIHVDFEGPHKNLLVFNQVTHPPLDIGVTPGEQVYIFWARGFRQHLLAGYLEASPPRQVKISEPIFLLSTSLRHEERSVPEPGYMWVEIPLPYPRDAKVRREIMDISAGGFSFKCPTDASYFLPGTPISHLRIFSHNSEPFSTSGQIRHVSPFQAESGETYLKIGVQFQISNKVFAKGHAQARSAPRKSRRSGKKRGQKPSMASLITDALKRVLKNGFRFDPSKQSWEERKSPEQIRVFRHWNERKEEIVGLLNTTWNSPERRQSTVIVLPPAYGKRKEALGMFGHYLIKRFRSQRHDAVVLRYDAINTEGESYKDPECRYPGKETVHMTLSQGTEDLLNILDFLENNESFLVREVVIVSFSLSALHARKAILKDEKKRVHLWIAPMGVTNMKDLMFNISGGIDYFDLYRGGRDLGDVTVLGVVVDGNRFCHDACQCGYVSMDDAVRDMSEIDIPVIWLYGIHDAWVDPEGVERLLEAKKRGDKKVRILPTGHLPLNGEEALEVFDVIFQVLWPHIGPEPICEFTPNLLELNERQEKEWQRVPREAIPSKKKYWENYLLGARKDDLGYDVLRYCEEYVNFVQDQIDHLNLEARQLVADMGCGTGNLVVQYLDQYQGDPNDLPLFTLVDIVPEALNRTSEKCQSKAAEKGIPDDRFTYHEVDLDLHPALPIKKFILGELASLDQLKGQIPGLTDYSIDLWMRAYGPLLHQILRGKRVTQKDLAYLDERFPEIEKQVIIEFNGAANLVKRNLSPLVSFTHDFSESPAGIEYPSFSHLHLDLTQLRFQLPFPDNYFHSIVCSLLLPYLRNPLDTLAEFRRILKPGGILIVSSMKPDTDMSKIYGQMIKRITSGELPIPEDQREKVLTATRDFANVAAHLLHLVEERRFRFFHPDELIEMIQTCGLGDVRLMESYGDPPQAFIVQTRKAHECKS
jgi:ubiquinone/menaquinone biosynthesis C-methylase UbiE/esterase/lipase